MWFLAVSAYNGFSIITGASPGHYRRTGGVPSQKLLAYRCPSLYLRGIDWKVEEVHSRDKSPNERDPRKDGVRCERGAVIEEDYL